MKNDVILSLANQLFRAQNDLCPIAPIKKTHPDIDIESAYAISQHINQMRLENPGEREIGKKVGLTNPLVQNMFNVNQPDFGVLTSSMLRQNKSVVELKSTLIQPKAEGEIAFVLKRDIMGPGLTMTDIIQAIDFALPCFEIVDSRIENWNISIEDTIADNASCGLFVLGDTPVSIRGLDLRTCGMVLEKNGCVAATGAGAAVLDSPLNSVLWLANTFGHFGIALKAGEIILSGSLSSMVEVNRGDRLAVEISSIGRCEIAFR